MSTWEQNIAEIESREGESASWLSQQRSLLNIFEAARDMGITPEAVNTSRLSCLSTIIKTAKLAIREGNKNRLLYLFELADTLTVADLRLHLEIPTREVIPVIRRHFPEIGRTILSPSLNECQMENIQKRNRLQYSFVFRDEGQTPGY